MKQIKIKDELKRFEAALGKTSLTAEQKRNYMSVKENLLKRETSSRYLASGQTGMITRYRHGERVWHGMEVEDELYTGVESRRINGLTKIGEFTVCMPSNSAKNFMPSAFLALQQLGFNREVKHPVLVEFRLASPDVSAAYDKLLKCHIVTAVLYHDVQNTLRELEQEQRWLEDCLKTQPQIAI